MVLHKYLTSAKIEGVKPVKEKRVILLDFPID